MTRLFELVGDKRRGEEGRKWDLIVVVIKKMTVKVDLCL